MNRSSNELKYLWKTVPVAAAFAVALLAGARPAHAGTITAQGAVTAITDRADLGANAAEAHFDEGPTTGTIPLDLYTPIGLTFHTGALTAVLAGVTTPGSASQGNYYWAARFPTPIAGGGVNNPPAFCRYCGVATFSYPVTKVGLTASQNGTQYLTVWDTNGAMIGQVTWVPSSDAAFVGLDTGGVEIGMVAYGNDDLWNGGTYGIGGSTIYSDTWVWGFCNLNGVVEAGEQCDDNNTVSGDGCSEFCIIETVRGGNSTVDPWEACDDGNNVDGDGCSANCMSDETCGNSYTDTPIGEQCDDGNNVDGDGCSANCMSDETCGNGVHDTVTGEVCDDGNNDDGDGCSADCMSDESCGNGVLDTAAGEVCDDGNVTGGDGCSADCLSDESCGNSITDTDAGEQCDDGNHINADGCSADCLSDETCGNGVVDDLLGEECDDGNNIGGDGCEADCTQPPCGNGRMDEGEACDDGNNVDGDGCNATCTSTEICGNGVHDEHVGEECDDGLFNSDTFPNACRSNCQLPFCGDDVRDTGEECDDGLNNNDETGPCSLACMIIDDTNGGGGASSRGCGCAKGTVADTGELPPPPVLLLVIGLFLLALRRWKTN